jgi:hypothetical protein
MTDTPDEVPDDLPDQSDDARKRNFDAAFHPEEGIRICKHCGARVPWQTVPDWKTGELVTGAITTWPRPDACPVDTDKPCPFLAQDPDQQ